MWRQGPESKYKQQLNAHTENNPEKVLPIVFQLFVEQCVGVRVSRFLSQRKTEIVFVVVGK